MYLLRWLWKLFFKKKEFIAELGSYGTLAIDRSSKNYVKIMDAAQLNGYRYEAKDRHDPEFLEVTDQIIAELGKSFGISFYLLVNNSHREVEVELTTKILHPVITNPARQLRAKSQTDTFLYKTPYYQYLYIYFEHEYELVPGTWTFQVWKSGKLLLEKSFEVLLK